MAGASTGAIHVLHVDDEPGFSELAAEFLERQSDRLAVETATGASAGLERLRDGQFDCVVSDYEMPGTDGIEFLEAVRTEYPDLPFILYTGRGSEAVASDAISAGVTDYLQKEQGTSQYEVLANRITNTVEQYRARSELERSRRRLDLFFEQSPLGVIRWNRDFEVERANEKATEILGYEEGDLHGRSWTAIVPDAARADVESVVSNLLADEGGYHSLNENVRGDGERIVCEWHNRVVTDGGEVVAIYSQFQDVTERRERERRFEAIFNNTYTFTGLLDPDGTVLEVNETALEFGDLDRADVVGRPIWDAYWFGASEEARATAKEAVERARSGELFRAEVGVRGATEDAIIDFSVRPVFDEDGAVTLLVPEGRDITDKTERERELRETKAALESTATELARQNRAFESFFEVVNDATLSVDERMTALLDLGVEFLGLDVGIVSKIDPPAYRVQHVVDPDGSIEQGAVLDFRDTFCTLVYEADGPVAFHTPEEGEVLDHPCYRDLGLAAYLGEPLVVDGERYGTLNFSSPTPREEPFTDGERAFVRTMSEWVSTALGRHRLDRAASLERLHGATREMMDARSTAAVVETGSDAAADVLGLPMNGIHLYEPDRDALVPVAWTDALERVIDGAPPALPLQDSLAGRAYRTGEPATYADVRAVEEGHDPDTPLRSELLLPLGDHGVLVAGSTTPDDFDASDAALAQVLAANVESALDRVERETALARQQSLLEAQQESVLDGMLVTDEDRQIISYNDRFVEMWDLPAGVIEEGDDERAVEAVIDGIADPDAFRETVAYLHDHPDETTHDEVELTDGRVFERYTTPLVGEAGAHYGRLWTFRDVTERKERLRELERERNRFEAVFESVPDPTVHVVFEDGEPVVRHVNDAFEDVFGYGAAEARGESVDDLVVSGERRAAAMDITDAVREDGRLQTEVTRATVSGERPFLFTARTMVLGEGDTDRVEGVGTYVDLSEQKRRETELARQNERLEEFAGVLSHDLRNPLNVAAGRLELAREAHDSAHLEAVSSALDRMEELIEATLTLAREGGRVCDFESVDLADLARACWGNVDTADATLEIETDRTVRGDSSRLAQLLENLFRNAVEHGGQAVEITVGDLADATGFYVADDGPGVPEDARGTVFEPGYSSAEAGTGFGLAIVKQIAEAHGWAVALREGGDGGARFEFTGAEQA